jgi:hypothetical protein
MEEALSKLGTWITIAIMLALLAATAYVAYRGWTSTDVAIPTTGYVAMWLGIIFSLAVGIGLMTLVFYSNRKGYDEPPELDE